MFEHTYTQELLLLVIAESVNEVCDCVSNKESKCARISAAAAEEISCMHNRSNISSHNTTQQKVKSLMKDMHKAEGYSLHK